MTATVGELLRAQAGRRGAQAAITAVAGGGLSYQELDRAADRLASRLLGLGVARGEPVGLAFGQGEAPDYATAYFGVQRAGGVVLPLNPRSPEPEAASLLADAGARRVLLGAGAGEGVRRAALARALVWPLEAAAGTTPLPRLGGEDPAELLYTSGTTGRPKGVLVPHRNAVGQLNPVYEVFLGGRLFLNPLPPHTYAGNAYLVFCVKAGLTDLWMERFEPAAYLDLLGRPSVTVTYGVAPMWLRVLKEVPDLERRDLSHVVSVSFGAAPMPAWAVARLGRLFPRAFLYNVYGLTEGGSAVCTLAPGDHLRRPGSVGRPVGQTEVRVVDPEGGACPPSRAGEVHLRLSGVPPRSYLHDPVATGQVWDPEGWVRTGDIGYLDEEGYLYLVDRSKDLVIQGGNNVASVEVEEALLAHPEVLEAAVIGIPHETLGEEVTAVVVPRDRRSPPAAAELREFLAGRLATYKVPRRIDLAEGLPRNALGKVLKRQLREERGA
ncbi:MAG: acyl--CoA ligase [Planctomycetes bacterium]|nr:acyl--CoA ligase [Planctomycetota bacterium]